MTTTVDSSAPCLEAEKRALSSPQDTRRHGFLGGTLRAFCKAIETLAPEGYQDDKGFHLGAEAAPSEGSLGQGPGQ